MLVVPVRVHRFVGAQGGTARITRSFVSQVFDPGAVATQSQLSSDDGFASRVTVVSGQLPRSPIEPDAIWTQCDIQFHLELYEEIPQTAGLERTQARSCVCGTRGLFGVNEPISQFFPSRDGTTAFDVFIGGSISGEGCPASTAGITCGPSNSGLGGSCEDAVGRHRFNVVLLDQNRFFSTPNLLAHELGHMLGLRHPDGRSGCLDPDDTEGATNLLMFGGGGDDDPSITPAQCVRARCIAARWLERFGRLSPAQREAVCSE